jgi:hypothetical protein
MICNAREAAAPRISRALTLFSMLAATALSLLPQAAQALPAFARQTGQNCVSCHAGGQFPELTPYGRMFKLTGYTIGSRNVPLSVMGVVAYAKVANTSKSDDPSVDFSKNGDPLFATGSVFLAGKVTDNIGMFVQSTYDNYVLSPDGTEYQGHTSADNMDIRYADRFISGNRDLIFGVSLNNNPSVADPWNTAAAWMQYVPVPSPTSHQFIDGNAPYPGFGAGGNLAGVSAYLFWNKMLYAELGTYQTANKAFSFMSAGIADADTTKLQGGNNPYWRLALSHDSGPHSLMVGTSGMVAHVYDTGSDTSDSNNLGRFKNLGVDAQYQYILDPHTITAQLAYMRQTQDYSPNEAPNYSNPSDTTNTFRSKLSYVYQAKYGGSLSFFNLTGTTDTGFVDTTRVTGNASGDPATRGLTYEAFWTPVQYVRVGAQYTAYSKYNGASDNYDGSGRNARDNNTFFLYVWGAY